MGYDNPPSIEELKAEGARARAERLKNYPAVETATLRDLFAAFALAGIVTYDHLRNRPLEAAKNAYEHADAMLAQRSKES